MTQPTNRRVYKFLGHNYTHAICIKYMMIHGVELGKCTFVNVGDEGGGWHPVHEYIFQWGIQQLSDSVTTIYTYSQIQPAERMKRGRGRGGNSWRNGFQLLWRNEKGLQGDGKDCDNSRLKGFDIGFLTLICQTKEV